MLYRYLNRDIIKLVLIQTYAPSRGAGFSYFLWLWSSREDSGARGRVCTCVVPKEVDFTSLHRQNTPSFPSAICKSDLRKTDILGNDFQSVLFSPNRSQRDRVASTKPESKAPCGRCTPQTGWIQYTQDTVTVTADLFSISFLHKIQSYPL